MSGTGSHLLREGHLVRFKFLMLLMNYENQFAKYHPMVWMQRENKCISEEVSSSLQKITIDDN